MPLPLVALTHPRQLTYFPMIRQELRTRYWNFDVEVMSCPLLLYPLVSAASPEACLLASFILSPPRRATSSCLHDRSTPCVVTFSRDFLGRI